MENDILKRLEELIEQATKERSHFYVKKCATDARNEIMSLKQKIAAAMSILNNP